MQTHVASVTLRNAAFAHWPVDPAAARTLVPDALDVATFDGDAWVSVVGVEMADVRPRGIPVGRTFPQRNLRTYVRRRGERGVYFVSLDAPDPVGVPVARLLFGLPYHRAEVSYARRGDELLFRSRRRNPPRPTFDAAFARRGDPAVPDPDSLDAFLAENYRFFAGDDRVFTGAIDHPPWRLREADVTVLENSTLEAHGVDAASVRRSLDDPVGRLAEPTPVTIELPGVVRR